MQKNSVVIVNGARTPMGGLLGSLSTVTAVDLGATAISATIERSQIQAEDIDEVIMGCVLPAGLKQCPARQAAIGAGVPATAGAVTVNKACGSGMQAVIYGHDSIVAGTNTAVIAGGMENMSRAPHILPQARNGVGSGQQAIYDHMFIDGLEDAYTGRAMGSFAQSTAEGRGITREQMDSFAITSLQRAKQAIEDGNLRNEMAPVTVTTRKGNTVVRDDEQPAKAILDNIPKLRPAFAANGSITAANASSISDGASALLLMPYAASQARGLRPMACLLAHARHSQAPGEFTTAPIGAIQKVLAKVAWSIDDVDLYEINEAFAMVTMMAIQDLGLDHAKVNVHGGACAQGHPIGSTGARIIVTLMHALQQRNKRRGVAALCIGGGEATAVAIELI